MFVVNVIVVIECISNFDESGFILEVRFQGDFIIAFI